MTRLERSNKVINCLLRRDPVYKVSFRQSRNNTPTNMTILLNPQFRYPKQTRKVSLYTTNRFSSSEWKSIFDSLDPNPSLSNSVVGHKSELIFSPARKYAFAWQSKRVLSRT